MTQHILSRHFSQEKKVVENVVEDIEKIKAELSYAKYNYESLAYLVRDLIHIAEETEIRFDTCDDRDEFDNTVAKIVKFLEWREYR